MGMKQNPADTIARLSRALAQDFQIMAIHEPDAPLFLAIALPTDEGVTGLKPRLPAGRGMTMQQAMIAAGAEALELRASLAQRHAGELRGLPRRDGLATLEASDLLTGETARVLAQEVYLDCASVLAEPLRRDANSTGCAVGADRESAVATALWECVERDALALWWHGTLRGAAVALDVIDAHQPRLFWWLHQRSRVTRLLDITTDIGLPVVVAVASDPDGACVALGSAARPMLEDAALAAVTEMVQTEVSLTHACEAEDPEALAWVAHASTVTQPQFTPDLSRPAPIAPPRTTPDLVRRLSELGHPALAIEMTLADDPLPSVRVLVPGLCAMRGETDTPRFARLCPGAPRLNMPEPF
jgi:ribosomal protein S12 methylthiotransferase accessory factor YcaO